MSDALSDLPPFGVIAAALRRTTEHLARELASPSASTPDWSPFEWDVARAVSSMQGITVLLGNRLRWQGPKPWQDFLEAQRRQALQRDSRIDALLGRIDAAFGAVSVCAVGLKGTALRRLSLYAAGERPMGDIDLLTRREDRAKIGRVLRRLDYVEAFNISRHHVFRPRVKSAAIANGEHPDNPLKIEIHEDVSEQLPVRRVDITRALCTREMYPGINPYPDDAELMRHLLLHVAGNMCAHALRQIQLHDIALLANRLSEQQWRKLLYARNDDGASWWMYPALILTTRYYPASICPLLAHFAKACPPVLRLIAKHQALTRVSWSNLRIHAFPGLCWSRSPIDVSRYVRHRILPGSAALAEQALTLAAQPELQQIPWYGVGRSQRILRWIVSQPPRVQTTMSLRAALNEPGGRS